MNRFLARFKDGKLADTVVWGVILVVVLIVLALLYYGDGSGVGME